MDIKKSVSDQIRGMAVGASLLLRQKSHNSIKAMVSRIGHSVGRTYITKKAGKTAVRVWRLT